VRGAHGGARRFEPHPGDDDSDAIRIPSSAAERRQVHVVNPSERARDRNEEPHHPTLLVPSIRDGRAFLLIDTAGAASRQIEDLVERASVRRRCKPSTKRTWSLCARCATTRARTGRDC